MAITDLSSFTSKLGVTTTVWLYDEADTYVVQHDFLHMSFFKPDFLEFVDTLLEARNQVCVDENPVLHLRTLSGGNPGEGPSTTGKENQLAVVEDDE